MAKIVLALELSKKFQHQILSIPWDVMCEVFSEIHLYAVGEIDSFTQLYVCDSGKLWFVDIDTTDVRVFYK